MRLFAQVRTEECVDSAESPEGRNTPVPDPSLAAKALGSGFAWVIVDLAPDGILVSDDRGRILMVNRQVEELFGFRRETLIDAPVETLLPVRLRSTHELHRVHYSTAPILRPMGTGRELFGRHADGSEFPVEVSLSPAETDRGLVTVVVIRDVSERRMMAEEQAALRRVATLVARGAPPEAVFASVTEEVGRVLGADYTLMGRYDTAGVMTVLGAWDNAATTVAPPLGTQVELGGRNATTAVFDTGAPARIDHTGDASGAPADLARSFGSREMVGVPISVEGRLWGVMSVFSTHDQQLPENTEARLTRFTELVGTAIANAEAHAELTASRARIVAAADSARRRIEHDLHDGAQQRLVSLALQLQTAQTLVPEGAEELGKQLTRAALAVDGVLDEIREIAHGIHSAALTRGGLRPALVELARRSAIPVDLDIRVDGRMPDRVELAAYYAVCEAMANAAKHASASEIHVDAAVDQGMLLVEVRDDGRGGASFSRGTGLVGLKDRIETVGGKLSVRSEHGAGTTVTITLPLGGLDMVTST